MSQDPMTPGPRVAMPLDQQPTPPDNPPHTKPTKWDRFKQAILAFPRWLASFTNPLDPRTSAKRGAMIASAGTLCYGYGIIAKSYAHAVAAGGHLTIGDAAVLTAASVPLAGLAGVIYVMRKDGSIEVSPTRKPTNPEPQEPGPKPEGDPA